MIPKTTGYTEIVKAIESGLNGDKETCRKFVERFVIKFPVESDLTYAFRHLLEGNKNPQGLHLDGDVQDEKDNKLSGLLKAQKCAEWLIYCKSIGWDERSIPALQRIWEENHDEKGNYKPQI